MRHPSTAASLNMKDHATAPAFPAGVIPFPHGQPSPAPPGKEADLRKGEQIRDLALHQLDRFLTLETKVLRGDGTDAVHDMRVASRRLELALNVLFERPFPARLRRARRKIRRSRKALSEVRNCDVLTERVEKALSSRRTTRREVWESFGEYLRERRARAQRKAMRKLSGLNLAATYLRVKDALAAVAPITRSSTLPPETAPASDGAEPTIKRLRQELERLWQKYEALIAESRQDSHPTVIHRARIATKRLRYLAEILVEIDGVESRPALSALRTLQERLGLWHDREIADQFMREMVSQTDVLRDRLNVAGGLMRLIALNRRAKKLTEQKALATLAKGPVAAQVRSWVGSVLESSSRVRFSGAVQPAAVSELE